jgi:calreticulin
MIYAFIVLVAIFNLISAKVYFKEQFGDGWEKRWVVPSDWKDASELGKWEHTAGLWHGDVNDKGIQTSEDARFYGLSAVMDSALDNKNKELVVQFSVKHEQELDCGGAYIKLLPGKVDQAKFGGDTPYAIMFGPDVCGSSNRKTHVIFNYPPKDDNLLITNQVRVETDKLTHVYTLVVKPDNTFEVLIDGESARSGKLEDEFDFLLPREINDPDVSKPKDWIDEVKIADPADKKPDGWDDIPESIPDPEATKPDDWDDEEDGEWEPPLIDNPDYKGPWEPKMIDNPDYKGEWEHPKIPNPEYIEDKELHHRCTDCTTVGFELWQVKSGTIFDDIIVTDSLAEAQAFTKETYEAKKDAEKAMYDAAEAEKSKAAADAAGAEGDEEEEEEEGLEEEL